MDFESTEEHRMIRRMVREFAEREIAPRAEEIDATDRFPDDLFRRMGALGILGMPFPEAYGGSGSSYTSLIIALEEIARVSGSMAIALDAHTSLCCEPIYLFGTDAQKRTYLTPLALGEKIGAFGLTEPEAGSDAGATRTRAVRDGDEWVINGQKIFITNGSIADISVITAKTDPEKGTRGISAFIVEKGTPGFQPGRDEKKMGLKGSVTSELFFENCRIPAENLLGNENEGFKQFLVVLDGGRIARAIAYLHDVYPESPSLAQISKQAHMSPFHFHRLFSRQAGISPKHYLQKKQLQVAKWLLRSSKHSIGSIAAHTGFASHGHFTSTFHRLVGVSPTEYRQQD